MENIAERVRPVLFGMVPYSPGKPITEVQREYQLDDIVKLASNENPLGASEQAKQAIKQALVDLHRYPDGAQFDLKQALSAQLQVSVDSLLIGNGSDEIIKLLCETLVLPGDEVLFPTPSFSEYEFGAKLMDAKCTAIPLRPDFTYDLDQFAAAISERTKIVFLCSPNNPTGTYIPYPELAAFVRQVPKHTVVVVDEAYLEYADAPDYDSAAGLLREGHTVVCMRTFSKAYGLAALRVGYCVTTPELVDFINRTREPFNVNHLAQVAAVAALQDQEHVERSVSLNGEERLKLTRQLEELGMKVIPSQANFILFDTGQDSKQLFQRLLEKGVIVRVFSSLPTWIRLSIGTAAENDVFLAAFREAVQLKVQG